MPLILADRVRDTTTTTGTGTVTLSGTAPTGYQNFSVIGNGNTTYYTINAGSQWEVGIGTYSSTGPTLARNTVLESSNANALVNFAAGTKDVFVTYPSDEAVYQDGATIAAGTAVLGVTNGGTGVTTSTGSVSVVLSKSPTLETPILGAATATSIANGLGAVGTPSYTFVGDSNTGMWSPAADTIAFSEGGVEVMRINSAGNLGIGTSAPAQTLQVVNAGNYQFRLGAGSTFNYDLGRSGSDGLLYFYGNQSTFTGYVFGGVDGERMRINASGNVGINTTAPGARLQINVQDGFRFDVEAGAASTMRFGSALTGESTGALAWVRSAGAMTFSSGASGSALTERMRIDASGNVGIGTSSPSFQLQLSTDSAAKPTTALWTIASDSRLKNETGEYTKGLDAVCALRPVTYTYNGAAGFLADGRENISIIAQEAMDYFPECVGTYYAKMYEDDQDETELYNWNGHALVFALVNAVKELKTQNDELRARVAQLEGN